MNKVYLTLSEISEILQFEEPNLYEEFNELKDEIKQYAAQKATFTIESLGILNRSKKEGELTFPLPYQKGVLGFDLKLCVALETLYIALKKESEELKMARIGIVAESDKSASATYDKAFVSSLKGCTFKNIKAYELIKKYIPKSYYME